MRMLLNNMKILLVLLTLTLIGVGCSKQSEQRMNNTADSLKETIKETVDSIKAEMKEIGKDSAGNDTISSDSTKIK